MKRVIVDKIDSDTVNLSAVKEDVVPLFAKKDGVLKGMVVHDPERRGGFYE